ncbi:Acyl- N-acyltransferase protein [Rutstroemia sp. NJR-2017a WRK4]|nr:Acyl- N-acyltransferase protein [Rutstroemia sp. NJR-2017a WRK4]PQE11831.1 Acyl- N-acyltransferase protein [Rutstroemia sp. NJR-2017a WRK4]
MAPKNLSKTDPIDHANAKSLVDFERDYLPPRSSYTPYVIPSRSPQSEVDIELHTPETLSSAELTTLLDLVAKTSGKHYRASAMGWNQRKKRAEMRLRDLKYLVVRGRGELDREGGGEGKDVGGDEKEGEKVGEKGEVKVNEGRVGRDQAVVGKKRKRTTDEDADTEKSPPNPSEKQPPEILGFASFMPTYEDGKKVIYVYEIHLEEQLRGLVSIHNYPIQSNPTPIFQLQSTLTSNPRRTKLSQTLMSLIQHAAEKIPGVEKVMLTCFTANAAARRFYERLGYEVDEFSPEPRVMRGGKEVRADYMILSRGVGG